MANSKISALTSATTVAGTEVLPIVQSSATVKVSVANLTPGLDTITAAKGGTGQTSYAIGDLLYANTTTTLAKLADVATGNALISGGVSTAPSWGKIGLTTHVSGTLPTANGGTNLTSFTSGGVVYASSTSALATGSALTFDGTNLGIGTATVLSGYKLDVRGLVSSASGYGGLYSIYDTITSTQVGYFSTDAQAIGNNDTNVAIVAAQSGKGIKFYTSGANERGRFTSGGYFKASNTGTYLVSAGDFHEFRGDSANSYVVIVGSTSATPLYEYIQDWRFSASTPNNANARFWNCTDATADRAYMLSNGGLANYAANNVILSDRREKTNFAPATSYLDKICAIPVQTFNYIDQNMEEDGGLTLGVVAQDVQAVAPELVSEGNWGSKDKPKMRLEIYQTDLQYALMKCIQEQQEIITQLTARVTQLESKP